MSEIGAAEMVNDAAGNEEIARLEAANEKLKEAARKKSWKRRKYSD